LSTKLRKAKAAELVLLLRRFQPAARCVRHSWLPPHPLIRLHHRLYPQPRAFRVGDGCRRATGRQHSACHGSRKVALSTRTAERDSRCFRFFSQPLSALSRITSSKGRNAGTQARQTQPSHAPLFVPCACHSFQAPHLRRHSRGLSSCRKGARERENLDAAMMTVGVFSSRRLSAASRRRSKEEKASAQGLRTDKCTA